MSKYLKLFDTNAKYEAYVNGGEIYLPNVSLVEESMSVGFKPYVYNPSQEYFTMVVTTGGDITWTGTGDNALSYSTDNGQTWSDESVNITIPIAAGNKVLWKGTTTPYSYSGEDEEVYGIGKFSGDTNARYFVEGNVMSLLYSDDFKEETNLEDYALYWLFCDNQNITSAENLSLPATTLADWCYYQMFYGCTNLTIAPSVLPATELADNCYSYMFASCTSLTTAPELPATTLASNCYYLMFIYCTNLTTAPELPATTLADSCYRQMFEGCTSLTTAPELPATTLVYGCYNNMFYGCTSLSSIKCLATNISTSNCTYEWVKNVAASGTFTKAASMTSWTTGKNGIPSGWTVVDA